MRTTRTKHPDMSVAIESSMEPVIFHAMVQVYSVIFATRVNTLLHCVCLHACKTI